MKALLPRLADRPFAVFAGWATLLGLAHVFGRAAVSWHSFTLGTHLLMSSAAPHLYAQHSVLQIGPVTYLVIAPVVFALPGLAGQWAAMALCDAAGLLLLAQLRRLGGPARREPAGRVRFLLAGLAVLTVWSQLAITYVHPDDALALLLGTVALRIARADRALLAAVALGLASDCKPWALAFVPVLLLADRRRLAGLLTWAATVALAWLPFYLADPHSSAAARFRIPNVATSSLRVFGVHAAGTPQWDRPAQVLLGAALGVVAVRRGNWPAVLLVAVCARLLLDPATKSYYDVGLLVGAAICDVVSGRGRLPWLSLSALLLFSAPRVLQGAAPQLYGLDRTGYLLILLAVLLLPDHRAAAGKRRTGAVGAPLALPS